MPFAIVVSRLNAGQRLPVLVRTKPFEPVVVPFAYAVLRRSSYAFNTLRNDASALKALYEYFEARGMDLDAALIQGQLKSVLHGLEPFITWISSGRSADNIVGRLGSGNQARGLPGIAATTRNSYLQALKGFLVWCAQRYPNDCSPGAVGRDLDALLDRVARRFDAYLRKGSSVRDYKSLTDEEIQLVRKTVHPASATNPFRPALRIRNALIIEVFVETGLRRGEQLALWTRDINRGEEQCYLSVVRRPATEDPRKRPPSLKTQNSARTVAISSSLYEGIQHYIEHCRRPLRHGRPMKLQHGFLWVSERGAPLALSGLNNIVDVAIATARRSSPLLLEDASPHSFRHTFADRFLAYMVDVRGFDMERAKDELRAICGWSITSPMPQHYSRRLINTQANRHNADRVEAAWRRLHAATSSFLPTRNADI
jgi:integrase